LVGQLPATARKPKRGAWGWSRNANRVRDELNRIGFHLYEQFRPEVPEGVKGWGAKGELRLERIRHAKL
jgi:hypothetical protein